MKLIKADGKSERELLSSIRARSAETDLEVSRTVTEIIEAVRAGGDAAVLDYTERFDGVRPDPLELDPALLDRACLGAPREFLDAMGRAAENIRDFHARQRREGFVFAGEDGSLVGQRIIPLARAGLYVPGGRAAYPSSVLMNAIPAKAAGVRELVMATPPGRDGQISPYILAAAKLSGVDRVFAMGGAQAIAALAFGTASVPKVDKIVGPGNVFVAAAKRMVFGQVDIDMIAGPSEILIIADETADPAYAAADLMSQAEHDPMASALLATVSGEFALRVLAEIDRQKAGLSRGEIIEKSLENFGAAVIFESLEACLEFSNSLAPEHLELMVDQPASWLGKVENAGSVFLGPYSPEPLGDYYAGPNHVLPTGGTARFFSPLSADAFVKKSSFTYYSREALAAGKDDIMAIAMAEGLTAHANSVKVRFDS